MAGRVDRGPWVIVAGGFHERGGMDRANRALAEYLIHTGTPVDLVGHEIDAAFAGHPLARLHHVPRVPGMPSLSEALLGRAGRRVARTVTGGDPRARVVVNGGNCPWPGVNWVHAVHAAWPVSDGGAPVWSRVRHRRLKRAARRRERAAIRQAQLVIANSDATRRAIVACFATPHERVRTVYLGSDPAWGPVSDDERADARARLAIPRGAAVVAFVGALGADVNKGFDVLWDAWRRLRRTEAWDAQLLVAGGGWRLRRWQQEASARPDGYAARFVGFTGDVRTVLAAADLLVSPVRYEAYGLNVHEALCCGVPVMVTRTAGVVERFDHGWSDGLLPENVSADELAHRLRAWRADVRGWRERAAPSARRVRARSWADMAAEFVSVVEQLPARIPA